MEDRAKLMLFWFGFMIMTLAVSYSLVEGSVGTPEYEKGYSLGYSEHNETKYQAAEFVLKDFVHYTDQQRKYASGYYNGYDAYNYDILINAEARERNETLKVLGV